MSPQKLRPKVANKRRNSRGKGSQWKHLGPQKNTWPIKLIWPNKKTKTTCLIGANFLESLHESDLAIHTQYVSQLTVGILGSTNSHTSRGVTNYPVILTIQYRILYNMLHHSNHDLPINKTRTQFRKFSHFLTTPTCKSAPIFDHISPKSCKQATHHLFLGNQNAHVKYDVKNLHLPSDLTLVIENPPVILGQ